MAEVGYLSWTGFATMLSCPEAYKHRYIDKIPEIDADQANFVKGNALHHLLEAFLTGTTDDANFVIENAPLFWSRELTSIEKNPRQMLSWSTADKEKHRKIYMDWAFELAKILKTHNLIPSRVQSEFKADCFVTLGPHRLKLGGRIDMLLTNKQGNPVILDLKSSVNKSIVKPDQLVWYALLTDLFMGKKLDAPVSHGGFILPGFPEGQKLQMFEITESVKENLVLRIIEVLDKIKADQFAPIDGKGCWFCPYKDICSIKGGMLPKNSGMINLLGNQ